MRSALLLIVALSLPDFALAQAVEWANGRWFDGRTFVEGTRWSVDGRFVARKPGALDRRVDLDWKFLVPAFGDAHHHGIDSPQGLDLKIEAFRYAGIFYVKNPNVIPELLTPAARALLASEQGIDVSLSNGGLTATGGHPAPLHAYLASMGVFERIKADQMENRAYYFIDDEASLEAKWPRILAGKPDFIKTFLGFSEEFEKRKDNPAVHKGLDPRLLPAIVRKARASNLRVSTHIDTAADFRAAVEAGVDEINHTPVADPRFSPDLSAYLIDAATARLAAERGIVVVTTASTTERLSGPGLGQSWISAMRANQAANLKTLREAGVRLAIGSDGISGEKVFATGRDEALFLGRHQMLDNLTILRAFCVEAPRTIFPNRKVGGLGPGYEASFLALSGDPILDIANVERIVMRVRNGRVLAPMSPITLGR